MTNNHFTVFKQINDRRRREGKEPLKWEEFRTKRDGPVLKGDYIQREAPRPVQRPPAVYNNHSSREKYGL